jgi:hypothetical protein
LLLQRAHPPPLGLAGLRDRGPRRRRQSSNGVLTDAQRDALVDALAALKIDMLTSCVLEETGYDALLASLDASLPPPR